MRGDKCRLQSPEFSGLCFFVQKLSANKIGGGILVRIFYAIAH